VIELPQDVEVFPELPSNDEEFPAKVIKVAKVNRQPCKLSKAAKNKLAPLVTIPISLK